ncbi:hypothetical protein VPH35_007092 [Triticum aestivum]
MDNTNVSDHPSIFNSSVAEFASIRWRRIIDEVPVITVDIYDPSNLGNLDNNSRGILTLVEKGPKREEENTKYSLDENSRYFSYTHYSRNNCNGEVHDRKWLLFNSNKCKSALGHKGFCDWKHINERPKGHAASVYHITNINSWNELSTRLRQHETN